MSDTPVTPRPTFSLCYTTVRPQAVEATIRLWMERSSNPRLINWSITTDADKPEVLEKFRQLQSDQIIYNVVSEIPGNCVRGWNLAAESLKMGGILGDIIIAVADDFVPPVNWDRELTAIAPDGWWFEDKVVRTWDGYNPDIFTLAILTAKRYDRFRYLFYPSYESMFSDTEFTAVAMSENVVIDASHLLFEHMHPDCGKRQRDANDLHHASTARWRTGELLFNYRKSIGFPVDDGPMADTTPVEAKDLAVHIQAVKDDFCLNEVCDRLVEEGVRAFFFYVPNEYWSEKPTPKSEIEEVSQCALRLSLNKELRVMFKVFDIARHRAPGRSRIQVETHARNEAMDWIRGYGYKHILIADGDELWKPGLMRKLLQVVNDIKPQCVYTGMIPTIGLPGYPIEDAQDFATIYIGRDAKFSECRGTYGTRYQLWGFNIIHFTATRRTMDEIIQKSRESGHYDDPNYDFEGWIANILPNIKAGMRNVHMYKPYNPWKRVRNWTDEEMKEIPSSLYPYLAVGQPA
jgi:hypothetical protein